MVLIISRLVCLILAMYPLVPNQQSIAAKGEEAATFQDLLTQGDNLETQVRKVKKIKQELDSKESSLKGAADALRRAQMGLRRKALEIDKEEQRIEGEDKKSGCRWGTRSKDIDYVNSCNALGEQLKGWQKEVEAKAMSLVEYNNKLQDQQRRLTEATVSWAQQKKENNADLDELNGELGRWQQRYNAFVFQSETYERLKKTAPGAQLCERLSGSGRYQELRSAAQCLQWLFDGARR